MSTVKISQLPVITRINANTANTLFPAVDVPSSGTGKITAHVLAQGLYSNEVLNVGGNDVVLDHVAAQFANTSETFLQVNLQNTNANGSSDYVATASNGTDANNYVDLGINGPNFVDVDFDATSPLDSYLYGHGPSHTSAQGNLIIGTASYQANLVFMIGGTKKSNVVAWMTKTGLVLNTSSKIVFADGSIQDTAAPSINYVQGVNTAQNTRMTISEGVDTSQNTRLTIIEGVDVGQNTRMTIIEGVNTTQNTNITAVDTYASGAYTKANAALANTTGTFAGDLTVTGTITSGNIIPSVTNTYSLGTSTMRWGDVWIGPSTINITDTVTGNNAALTVANGVLQVEGANQLQVGQLKFVDNTIESTTGNVDIQIGLTTSSANTLMNRDTKLATGKTLTFGDGTVQSFAYSPQIYFYNGTVNLANNTSTHSILVFDNGVYVQAGLRYQYTLRCQITASQPNVGLFYGNAGTAVYSASKYWATVGKSNYEPGMMPVTVVVVSAAADNQVRNMTNIASAIGTNVAWDMVIECTIDVTTSGYLSPKVLFSPAPGDCNVLPGAYMEIKSIGSKALDETAIGNWS